MPSDTRCPFLESRFVPIHGTGDYVASAGKVLMRMTGFKNFIMRGNLVELAVAVVIGTQFSNLVKRSRLPPPPDRDRADEDNADGGHGERPSALHHLAPPHLS